MANVGFLRRFTTDPGLSVITQIEGVVIIDRDPPSEFAGVGTGLACCVGEFEDGAFETPTQIFSSTDQLNFFGDFGYLYTDGTVANNPCARARKADGALNPEYWNGNGAIAIANKRFAALMLCRVNTSVGKVAFTRLASISGASALTYDLESGQTVKLDIGAGNVTATFTGVAALITSGAGVYPTTFIGGELITFAIDGTSYTVAFTAADQSHAQVVARLNLAVGYTAFAVSGAATTFTGRQRGTGGSVQIVSLDALVATATGFVAGVPVAGTGNVGNIDAVTVAEANTVIVAAIAGTAVDRDASNNIRVSNTATPGTGTIRFDSTSTATGFGFTPVDTVVSAAAGLDGTIPAGTPVKNVGGTVWVTMRTLTVTAGSAGPYSVEVRHGLDDGTGLAALAGAVVAVVQPIPLGAFSVSNPLPLTAALTEPQIDAKYQAAFDSTVNMTSDVKKADFIWSARQSNACRNMQKTNVLLAAQNGLKARDCCISPPLKTTRAAARSSLAQPGVGAYRSDRVFYCFPGIQTLMPQIATRGLGGGAGFTADGLIDTHFDSWVVSLLTQLAPEENPGQETPFLFGVNAIEAGNPDVQTMTMADYIAFRAAGIMAPRIDDGTAFIESGVTSVDPLVTPGRVNVARRRMADFINDSQAAICAPFVKKLQSKDKRGQLMGLLDAFMSGLESKLDPTLQRIDSYTLDGRTGNTDQSVALGVFRIKTKAKTLSSMDDIVLDNTIGESVVIQESA